MTKHRFPIPGQRIFRTMLAVWVCMLIYYLRGQSGLPFMAAVAAMQCIQPYTKNSCAAGKKRVVGTIIGVVWAAFMLFAEYLFVGRGQLEEAVRMVLAGACVGAVIYSTVLLQAQENAYFASVVFLSIVMNHAEDANPYIFIFNRVLDTFIGSVVGTFINSLHLPRVRHEEILFISGIDPMTTGRKTEEHHLTPYTRVELNRLIEDGAKFTVISRQTPATILEAMDGVTLKYPVIATDGALLFDTNERRTIHAERMGEDLSRKINALLEGEGAQHFIVTLEDGLITIYYHQITDSSLRHRYLRKRGSLYRNFVHTEREINENVLYHFSMGPTEEMAALVDQVQRQPWTDECRMQFDTYECEEGECILRIYAASATRERMLDRLRQDLKVDKIVKIGVNEPGVDEVIPYHGDRGVKEIKRRFETVDLRGWKNILRW